MKIGKNKREQVHSTNPPFVKLEKALLEFKNQAGWKDLIPFLLSWVTDNQPKDTAYDLKFWLKEYKNKLN